MSTNLSRFFRQARINRKLKISDVARMCGYHNLSKGSRKIHQFEESGYIHPDLFDKLEVVLDIDPDTSDQLIDQDGREAVKELLGYISTSIKPHMRLKKGQTPFHFGDGNGSLKLK
jgi:hypothetical protein